MRTQETGRAAPSVPRNHRQPGLNGHAAPKCLSIVRALPSLEAARSLLERCRATGECQKIRALAQAVASVAASEAARDEALAIVLLAKARIGELTAEVKATPPAEKGRRAHGVRTGAERTRTERLADDSLSRKDAAECERIASLKRSGDLDRMIASGARPTTAAAVALGGMDPAGRKKVLARLDDEPDLLRAIGDVRRQDVREKLDGAAAQEVKAVQGLFDVVVLDPPWPMVKIEREVRASQVGFDYPTMTEDQIRDLHVPCAGDCHVWLWTTQKFLPLAFELLAGWKLTYVCTFVWHKPGGYQPTGLPQYNCEFALYARRGSPKFVDTKALNTCFSAKRHGHSFKPEEFYEVVRRVTAGRRLDMFNRRKIDGFEGWGNEAGKSRSASTARSTTRGPRRSGLPARVGAGATTRGARQPVYHWHDRAHRLSPHCYAIDDRPAR